MLLGSFRKRREALDTELDRERRKDGLPPLEIHTPPFVTAEDGTRISSTRIRNGENDVHGRLLDSEG